MIRNGFLEGPERAALIKLARNGSAQHRLARRANALVLLDRGMSCEEVGSVLLLDDATIRNWYGLYREEGLEGLSGFGFEGSACRLSVEQQDRLKAWIARTLPRTTREIGAWIAAEFGIVYQSRSGLVTLLHRLGMEHRKPEAVSSKLDAARQQAFIEEYAALQKTLPDDEAVLFADAAHPTHQARTVGCWAPRETKVALDQSNGRRRLNLHGAIDLETGKTRMLDVPTVNALTTIELLEGIEELYPAMRRIHVFLDNARYHHAKIVRTWLDQPQRKIRLHFIPPYCPHLNPIERLWGVMHKNVSHNRCHPTFRDFRNQMLAFLTEKVPQNWNAFCDAVSDNFRIIHPDNFRLIN